MKIRRIVTAESKSGVVVQASDLPETATAGLPTNIWGFDQLPVLPLAAEQVLGEYQQKGLFGPKGALRVDVMSFPPETSNQAPDLGHFDQTFNTNARGTYFTVQKALPYLNDGASIILMVSAGKNKGFPGCSTYSATKAALRSFARTWTNELKERKIRTNVLSSGPVDTPLFDEQCPSEGGAAEARKQITAMTPLARLARPEEIAAAALFLASDQSSYVAGIDLPVDGGLTAV